MIINNPFQPGDFSTGSTTVAYIIFFTLNCKKDFNGYDGLCKTTFLPSNKYIILIFSLVTTAFF